MKKIISLVLVLVMLAVAAIPAFAVEVTPVDGQIDQSQGVVVEYGPSATYNVTILAAVNFGTTLAAKGNVEVSDVKISPVQKVSVNVTSLSGTGSAVKAALTTANVTGVVMEDSANKVAWTMIDKAGNSAAVPYTATTTVTLNNGDAGEAQAINATNTTVIEVQGAQSGAATEPTEGTAELNFSTDGTAQIGEYYDLLTFTVDVVDA